MDVLGEAHLVMLALTVFSVNHLGLRGLTGLVLEEQNAPALLGAWGVVADDDRGQRKAAVGVWRWTNMWEEDQRSA